MIPRQVIIHQRNFNHPIGPQPQPVPAIAVAPAVVALPEAANELQAVARYN
jgi:hypothetical protein